MKFLLLATQRYKRFVPMAALLLSVSLFLTLFIALGSFDIIENRILNVKFQLRPKIKIYPNIITLDIDDKDIDVTGRWPWPWFIHGDIVNFLTEYGVADIVFVNMDFSQGSNNAIDRGSLESVKNRILAGYGKKDIGSTIPDYEEYLSDSLKKNGNACADVDFKIPEPDGKHSVTGTLKTSATTIEKHSLELLSAKTAVEGSKWNFPVATNIIIPKESILKSMACAGFNQIHLSPDGVVRKYPLMAIYQNMLYGSLPLNLVRKLLHTENIYTGDSRYIKLKGKNSFVKIPVDNTGSMNINWAGSYNDTFARLPFSMISELVAYQITKDEIKKIPVAEDIEKYVPLKLSELPYISKEAADKIFARAFAAFYIEQNIVDHGMSEAEALTSMGLDPTDNFWLSMAKQIKFNNYIVKKHVENKVVPPLKDVITDLSLTENDLKSMNLTESYNLIAYHIKRNDVYRVRPLFFVMPDIDIDSKRTVISPLYLKDKIVFYGLTATALTALNPTPYLRHHPMLDLMPNVLNTIMTGQFLTDCPVWLKYSLNFILVVIVLNVVMLFTPIRSGPVTLLVTAVYAMLDWYFFTKQGLLLPTFQAVSAIALAFISGILYKYIRESMERQKIRKMFSAMVSPEVLKMLEKHPEKFNRGGEKKLATMFSSDVSGFTTISEGVTSRELADILNIYLTPMSNIIMSYDGYVDKYEGDAIKADFGIPLDDNDQALKCCLSALYSQEELKVIQRMIAIEYGVMITARMGINTGVISAAIMGSYNHMQYTAMGDAATFAEELEPANKIFDTCIMMSESTYDLVKDHIEARNLGAFERAHAAQSVKIYEVIGWRKDRFLNFWKDKPIPALILNSLSRMRPEKVIGYHDYFSEKDLPGSELLTEIKTMFSELSTVAVQYMKSKDILNITEIEAEIKTLLLKTEGHAVTLSIPIPEPQSTSNVSFTEKRLSELYKEIIKAVPYIKILKDMGERALSDSLYSRVDVLEKRLLSINKRISYATEADKIATELSEHLKTLLNKSGISVDTTAITAEMKTNERIINERLNQFASQLKKRPNEFHELISNFCTLDENKKTLLNIFNMAQQHYYNRNWDEAAESFKHCLSIDPHDGPSAKYLKTTEHLKEFLPDNNWQGIWQE